MKKIVFIAIISLFCLTSCQEKWGTPEIPPVAEMTPTMTIAQFKALYKGTPLVITDETIILSGQVVSSDKEGNFYRSFYIQDATGGIEVKIGKTGLYNDYRVGQTIYIKPKYLCLGAYGGMVQLGAPSKEARYETSYMDAQELINRTVIKGATGLMPMPIKISTASDINESNLGKLVTLEKFLYKGGDNGLTTWAVKEDLALGIKAASGNQNFYLGTRKVVVRTSGYARFATAPCPTIGSTCYITGVLTKFNTTYQLTLIDLNGIEVLK